MNSGINFVLQFETAPDNFDITAEDFFISEKIFSDTSLLRDIILRSRKVTGAVRISDEMVISII